jgi:multidrug resistance efflux pump
MLVALVLGIVVGSGFLVALQREGGRINDPALDAAPTPPERKVVPFKPDRVAADGVVEGARPEVAIRPEVAGVLVSVHVREDQDVTRGSLLAELDNEIQKQRVALAKAELARARAQLDRLRNGERAEKRKAAAAIAQAKKAIFQQAKSDWERSRLLAESRSASREEFERSFFTMQKSQSEWDQAVAEHALVEASARPDEIAIEEGNVAAAEARLRLSEAELAQTRLLAPSDGRILKVFAEPGEEAGPSTSQPVLLLADLSKRRVRAFVEELDAARVEVGQRAQVTADGLPGQIFDGTVALVLPRMGQRGPTSDAPGEYKDLYYREALIDLDAGDELPIDFRVQVLIQRSSRSKSKSKTQGQGVNGVAVK